MSGKIAVVVGGTGQVGRYIVRALNRDGYHTVSISRSEPSDTNAEPSIEYLYGDMIHLDQIERCCSDVSIRYGTIDVLVNLIGKNVSCAVDAITEEIWNDVIDSNLRSVFFICRTFANSMLESGGGSIINFSSTAGIRALPQSPHYIAAKAGVIALTEYFAKVYAPKVRVNCIAPGFILTENHWPENYTDYHKVLGRLPLEQMTSVDEIAEATLFCASSQTVTGHTLVIDGGLTL